MDKHYNRLADQLSEALTHTWAIIVLALVLAVIGHLLLPS